MCKEIDLLTQSARWAYKQNKNYQNVLFSFDDLIALNEYNRKTREREEDGELGR